MKSLETIKQDLKKYNQEHLLQKYDKMDDENKDYLLKQIDRIDFDLIDELYEKTKIEKDFNDIDLEPVKYLEPSRLTDVQKKNYIKRGIEEIKDNKLAVVTMAGGQGTRLGHTGPKGTFYLDLPEGRKSIFEILCNNIKEECKKMGVYVNWYIMTSEQNHKETVEFFEENNYFGYPKNYLKFFVQGKLPMVALNGKILLTENGFVKEASDGHGGTLRALKNSGILNEMKEKKIEYIFVSGVDNILAEFVNPMLIGIMDLEKRSSAMISVKKIDPKEKVGIICRKNKKIGVVEYTEITQEIANMRDDYGALVYGDLNSNLYCYRLGELEKVTSLRLPYHTAFKKASYLDENGQHIQGKEPNAYKFESFIFDSFEMLENVLVLRLKREDIFAPIKNRTGSDSPETAKKLYIDYKIKEKCLERYQEWLTEDIFDEDVKRELKEISGDYLEIKDRFYKELDFGTAGLRGIMGAGTNRMNKYTVLKATQGLANYINEKELQKKGVVICYDTRNNSKELATLTARCLNANNIKTYIMNEPRPVPMMSYSIRLLGATAGVMITASHNPPEYNGYKVMWEDGAQIIAPVDKEIINKVREIKKYSDVEMITLEEAKIKKLYIEIGPSIEHFYIRELLKLQLNKEIKEKEDLKIVYSPIHGTGYKMVPMILKQAGFKNVFVVPEQELPNGNFPTVESPNPENVSAMELAVKYGKKLDADIVLATDPDSDRVGCGVKTENGEYVLLSGNAIGQVLLEYILSSKKENNTLPENGAVISTVVSTKLAKKQAESYGVKYFETLTGFKNIARQIREFEEQKSYEFIFAFEESFGYLFGTQARDKDAVVSCMLLAELAAFTKSKQITIFDYLEDIYKKYGYYNAETSTILFSGESGERQRTQLMDNIRKDTFKMVGEYKVTELRDYEKLEKIDILTGEKTKIEDKYKTNMIYYVLENNAWIAIRPSGTEPKVKIYIEAIADSQEETEKIIRNLKLEMVRFKPGIEGKIKIKFRESRKIK